MQRKALQHAQVPLPQPWCQLNLQPRQAADAYRILALGVVQDPNVGGGHCAWPFLCMHSRSRVRVRLCVWGGGRRHVLPLSPCAYTCKQPVHSCVHATLVSFIASGTIRWCADDREAMEPALPPPPVGMSNPSGTNHPALRCPLHLIAPPSIGLELPQPSPPSLPALHSGMRDHQQAGPLQRQPPPPCLLRVHAPPAP